MSQKKRTPSVSKQWTPLPRYILRKRNVLRETRKLKGCGTFIDIGCGAGDLSCSLAEMGLRGKGFDFSSDAINVAKAMQKKRKIDPTRLTFIKSSVGIGKMHEKADIVYCLEVLEHIKKDKEAFAALVKMSKKYLVISVPAKRKLYGPSDTLAGHYRRYDKADLLELVDHPEVKLIRVLNYGFPVTMLSRLFLERGAAKKLQSGQNTVKKEDLSKDSGINIFKIPSLLRRTNLERIIAPFYYPTLLFNKADLSDGYLVILKKRASRN